MTCTVTILVMTRVYIGGSIVNAQAQLDVAAGGTV